MKKIISLLLVLILSVFVLSFTVSAEKPAPPQITKQPEGFTLTNTLTGHLHVEVAEYEGELTYKWYKGSASDMSDAVMVDDKSTTDYAPQKTIGVAYYQVGIVGTVFGETSDEVKSAVVRVEYTEHEHLYGDWVNDVEPTCTEVGKKSRNCLCGETEAMDIPALGHKWGDSQITKKPTETQTGEKVSICDVCKESKTESVPALGITDKVEDEPQTDVTQEKEETEKQTDKPQKKVKKGAVRWWMITFPALAFVMLVTAAVMIIRRYTRK